MSFVFYGRDEFLFFQSLFAVTHVLSRRDEDYARPPLLMSFYGRVFIYCWTDMRTVIKMSSSRQRTFDGGSCKKTRKSPPPSVHCQRELIADDRRAQGSQDDREKTIRPLAISKRSGRHRAQRVTRSVFSWLSSSHRHLVCLGRLDDRTIRAEREKERPDGVVIESLDRRDGEAVLKHGALSRALGAEGAVTSSPTAV